MKIAWKQRKSVKILGVRESLYLRNLTFAIGVRESLSPRKFLPAKLFTFKVTSVETSWIRCPKLNWMYGLDRFCALTGGVRIRDGDVKVSILTLTPKPLSSHIQSSIIPSVCWCTKWIPCCWLERGLYIVAHLFEKFGLKIFDVVMSSDYKSSQSTTHGMSNWEGFPARAFRRHILQWLIISQI